MKVMSDPIKTPEMADIKNSIDSSTGVLCCRLGYVSWNFYGVCDCYSLLKGYNRIKFYLRNIRCLEDRKYAAVEDFYKLPES